MLLSIRSNLGLFIPFSSVPWGVYTLFIGTMAQRMSVRLLLVLARLVKGYDNCCALFEAALQPLGACAEIRRDTKLVSCCHSFLDACERIRTFANVRKFNKYRPLLFEEKVKIKTKETIYSFWRIREKKRREIEN